MEFPFRKVSNLGLNVTIKGLHHMRILQDFSEQLFYIMEQLWRAAYTERNTLQ